MLSARERERLAEVLPAYETRSAAVVEALRIIQDERGWVSDEALNDLAAHLEVSVHLLDSLATFYSLIFRRPVGRHVIMVCGSVSCWLDGSDQVVAHLEDRLGVELGGTSNDGRFTLLPAVCLGACDQAPAMMVDGELYGRLTPASIGEILASYH